MSRTWKVLVSLRMCVLKWTEAAVKKLHCTDVLQAVPRQRSVGCFLLSILQSGILSPVWVLMDCSFMQLLQNRLSEGARKGEEGVLLDGFPRTRNQAEALLTFADVQLALNLSLREEVPFLPSLLCLPVLLKVLLHTSCCAICMYAQIRADKQ